VLTELPKNLPSAVVISQHMPKGFTHSLAERLDKLCSLRVKEAEQDDVIEDGHVYICPGGYHMSFRRRGGKVKIGLKKAASSDMYVPSVDIMKRSAADVYGTSTLGVVLTGMGNDGTDGMKKIASNGGINLAESEETAVVFGMPAGAIKAGVTHKVLPLDRMAGEIIKTVKAKR
jgi:two-component system chemotaxis response regulator CheB